MADLPGAYPPADIDAAGRDHGEGWDEIYALALLAPQLRTLRPSSVGIYHWSSRPDSQTATFAQNRIHFVPISVIPGFTYTRLGVKVTTAGGAGAVARLGIFDRDLVGNIGDLLVTDQTVGADSTGTKLVTISWTPTKSVYVAGIAFQGSATIPTIMGSSNNAIVQAGGLGNDFGENQGMYYQDSVSGAFPTTPTPVAAASWPIPCCMYGVA